MVLKQPRVSQNFRRISRVSQSRDVHLANSVCFRKSLSRNSFVCFYKTDVRTFCPRISITLTCQSSYTYLKMHKCVGLAKKIAIKSRLLVKSRIYH